MTNKIIVMGGSFNPPTIAHLKLMQSAIAQLSTGASLEVIRGIFVPSSDAYVRRKMGKKPTEADHTVLPEKMRLDMLKSFHELDHNLFVDDRELGTENVKGHTVDTLCAIQQENPDVQVYFIFGGDKVEGLPRWGSYEPLVTQFKVIIFGRDGLDAKQAIQSISELAKYSDSFVVLQQPVGLEGISSTAVREKLRRNDRADDMLTPDVYAMLLAYQKQKEHTILCFQGEDRFLSNFYPCRMLWKGVFYQSIEAAFQSAKCKTREERRAFTYLSPEDAKRKGRRIDLRPDWEDVKDGIMEEIVRLKFFKSESLAQRLLETGDAELIEGNTWGDMYWGVDLHTMQGQNKLGKILMKIRDELRNRWHTTVFIYSREEAQRLLQEDLFPDHAAVISFFDPLQPGKKPSEPEMDYSATLAPVFYVGARDIDRSVWEGEGNTYASYFPEADQLAEFIDQSLAAGFRLVCQCEYGQSRSAACAAAILQFYCGTGIEIFSDYRYYPNQMIYHKVFDALQNRKNRARDTM